MTYLVLNRMYVSLIYCIAFSINYMCFNKRPYATMQSQWQWHTHTHSTHTPRLLNASHSLSRPHAWTHQARESAIQHDFCLFSIVGALLLHDICISCMRFFSSSLNDHPAAKCNVCCVHHIHGSFLFFFLLSLIDLHCCTATFINFEWRSKTTAMHKQWK